MAGGGHREPPPIPVEFLQSLWEKIKDPAGFSEWLGDYWGVSRGMFLMLVFVSLYLFLGNLIPSLPLFTFNWLFGTAPIWAPIALIIGAYKTWIWYVQSLFLSGRNPVLLEVRMPRDVYKSPRAMEIAYTMFSISSGETTFLQRAWHGQVRPFFSFEMASFGGEVHYYVWCWKNYKPKVEIALYGQYPEVEIFEVEDYASKFEFDPKQHQAYCTDWRLETYAKSGINGKFEVNAYLPKSYIDFELDKDPKEEFKVDPIGTIVEFLGGIEPQEQIWLQIVMRKCGNQGVLWQTEQDHDWIHMMENAVTEIRREASEPDADVDLTPKERARLFPHPTWKQTEQIRTIERHLGKYPFEVGARGIYITTDHLHGPTYMGLRWLWKPIGNPHYMSHWRPKRWHNPFDYPWQDIADFRWNLTIKRFLDAYRRRLFFHSPWIIPTNVVTNEILATMWRPPSRTVATPGLQRIPSTKASAPPNLPV